jgi:hypothetical protein
VVANVLGTAMLLVLGVVVRFTVLLASTSLRKVMD